MELLINVIASPRQISQPWLPEGFFLLGILMDLCELSALADSTLTCSKWEGAQALLHPTSREPWFFHTWICLWLQQIYLWPEKNLLIQPMGAQEQNLLSSKQVLEVAE